MPISSAVLVVADTASKNAGAKALTFSGVARDVVAADVLQKLFPSTPALVITILRPVRFSSIQFTYDGTFGVVANPDFSGVPGLSTLLTYLGFGPNDIKLVPAAGALSISIQKTWTLNPGAPFVGSSVLQFALVLSQSGANTQFAAKADFTGVMRLSFLEPTDITFSMGATVAYDTTAPPPGVSFGLRASVSAAPGAPFRIVGFPWISINYIGASVALTPTGVVPFVLLRSFDFEASGSILDVAITVGWVGMYVE